VVYLGPVVVSLDHNSRTATNAHCDIDFEFVIKSRSKRLKISLKCCF